ncbi:MAG: fibro-slime family protein [Oceanospirillaceae bacterium]|nr:fibro-slime family protein [Oceanospirillaceae bacterium]MBT14203.1 fibro-slime family protein [Oceanospirillaceae bacterium]|tara:strand:+ start:12423 stop:13178 length:756 start_codon:yes stop_codon:yes gene_type:complete
MSNLKVAVGSLLVLTAGIAQANDTETSPVYEQRCECVVSDDDAYRTFPVVIRDFRSSHPDFENPNMGEDHDIVGPDLGPDRRPVYAPGEDGATKTTNGKEYFDQWYRNVDGVNMAINKSLTMVNEGSGAGYTRWKYTSDSFFPIDGEGFGNERNYHNYHFTLETHLRFYYAPGDTFTFRGDDDLYLFINGKLAMEIGGIHNVIEKTLDLDSVADELGIEPYNSYDFDLFFAERHTVLSNFQFETTMELECL